MEKYIPTFTDITDWEKLIFLSTGGTRSKNIYLNPAEDIRYFFKGSKKLKDNTFRYPMEFWSEIASSKIGQWLEFDMLDYNIGFDLNSLQQVGCLSKSMVSSVNTLTEGIEFLRGFDSSYNPEMDEARYTIEFIFKSMERFDLGHFQLHFIEMLIFDGIIGNSDRHQENWGIINDYENELKDLEKQLEKMKTKWGRFKLKVKQAINEGTQVRNLKSLDQNKRLTKSILNNQIFLNRRYFSPIYDSGCCLGREFTDESIKEKLKQPDTFKNYIKKGLSEVRYENGKKPKHRDMFYHLHLHHRKKVEQVQKRVRRIYIEDDLKKIIYNLDKKLPSSLNEYKLSNERKELMVKLITLRVENFLSL